MVSLIKYEMKKHFFKRSILIVLLVFSIINIVKINNVYQENSFISKSSSTIWNEVYWRLYDRFGGTMTLEKIEQLLSIYRPLEKQTADLTASRAMDNPNTYTGNVYSDYYLLTGYYIEPMEYAYMYHSTANDIVQTAKENMTFYNEISNNYKYRENKIIASLFADRCINEFSYTEMYQYYLEYDFSSLLVLLICLYGLVSVFVSEKESDMDIIIITTVSGGRKTVISKIIASIIFVFFICLWFWLLDFSAFSFFFQSFEAASSPVYALKNFENSSVNFTLSQYSFLSALVKTAGIMIIGLSFLLVSSTSRNALFPFILNLVITGVAIFYQEIMSGSERILAKIANPFILVTNSELFKKIEFINFFGIPVISYAAAILFATIVGIILVLLILFTTRKNVIAEQRWG
jgi:hypothetical protein